MIDARQMIYDALRSGCSPPVRGAHPESGETVPLPLIIYTEIDNVNIGKWSDRIDFQIDVYAGSINAARAILNDVDSVMRNIGFQRTYVNTDEEARRGKDFYQKTANYRATVNTHDLTIIGGVYNA